jgi:hypothetical protein
MAMGGVVTKLGGKSQGLREGDGAKEVVPLEQRSRRRHEGHAGTWSQSRRTQDRGLH